MKEINNGSEFDYNLSIHAANMLIKGLVVYFKMIKRWHRDKIEAPDYCGLVLGTNRIEATKLLTWFCKLETPLASNQIKDLEYLLEDIHEFDLVLQKAWRRYQKVVMKKKVIRRGW